MCGLTWQPLLGNPRMMKDLNLAVIIGSTYLEHTPMRFTFKEAQE